MTGNKKVIAADRQAASFQSGSNIGRVMSRGLVVGQNNQSGGKILDLSPIVDRPC